MQFLRFPDEKTPKTIELQLQGVLKARVWVTKLTNSKHSSGGRAGSEEPVGDEDRSVRAGGGEAGGRRAVASAHALYLPGSCLLFISWCMREAGPGWLRGQGRGSQPPAALICTCLLRII